MSGQPLRQLNRRDANTLRSSANILARCLMLALMLALGILPAGCSQGTYLEVHLAGPGLPEIRAMQIDLTLTPTTGGTQHAGQIVRPPGSPITLPTSIAFALDNDTGNVRVDVVALDAKDASVGKGSGTTEIMHGKTWRIDVNLTP